MAAFRTHPSWRLLALKSRDKQGCCFHSWAVIDGQSIYGFLFKIKLTFNLDESNYL